MNQHVIAWLGTYHDGELRGRRLRQVEHHLALCPTCRVELAGLQAVSTLLQENPAATELMASERFVAQVGLRLPRHPERLAWKRAIGIGWWMVPLGLFSAWAFIQTTIMVADMVLFALRLGLGGDVAGALLPTIPQQPLGLVEIAGLSDPGAYDILRMMLRLLNRGGPLGWGVVLNVVLAAAIGLLYCSWLTSWWALRQRRLARGMRAYAAR